VKKREENNMDFETFKESLAKDVKSILDERTGGNTTVETRTVDKMDAITYALGKWLIEVQQKANVSCLVQIRIL
jgi:hypothetical protein